MRLLDKLPHRHQQVAVLLCEEGLGNKEIAWRLHLTLSTTKVYIGQIYNLTGIHGERTFIVRYWQEKLRDLGNGELLPALHVPADADIHSAP